MTAEQYIADLKDSAQKQHPILALLSKPENIQQRVYYTGLRNDAYSADVKQILKQCENDMANKKHVVCVIENINQEWIGELGAAWGIDHEFFLEYASNAPGESLWNDVNGSNARERVYMQSEISDAYRTSQIGEVNPIARMPTQHYHIEGILPHLAHPEKQPIRPGTRRRFEYDAHYGWQANTRLSYYRVYDYLYLFLVDTPVSMEQNGPHLHRNRLSLWVPHARNRGGLPIPQMYERSHFSLFENLSSFFSHGWHLNKLFATREPVDFIAFSHFLAASVWLTNLRFIDHDIKRIAFHDIRKPNVRINNRLHDRRHDLDTLRAEVLMSKSWFLKGLDDLCRVETDSTWGRVTLPIETFEDVYKASEELQSFLMDTFQLLMSSISVLDSQSSIQEAKRSSQLTVLATIYVPLSFVTGIFGMNVKEINDSQVPIWTFVVTLLAFGFATVGALYFWKYFHRSNTDSAEQDHSYVDS